MKKLILFTFLFFAIASCQKASVHSLCKKWKMKAYTTTYTGYGDNKKILESSTTNATATDFTATEVDYYYDSITNSQATSTAKGTVNKYTYTFNKNGTWEATTDMTITSTINADGSVDNTVSNVVTTQSGTWCFIKKTKGEQYKKNERLLINVLLSVITTTSSMPGSSTAYTETETRSYAVGESSQTFNIDKSNSNELSISVKKDNSDHYSDSSGSNSEINSEDVIDVQLDFVKQ